MRTFLRDLTLLAGVTAAGGFALVIASSPQLPAPVLVFEPLVVDRVELTPVDHALEELRHAPDFAAAAVGYAGVVPNTVVAWLILDRSPHADSLFRNLLRTSALPGQLYALAGLRRTSPGFFREAARQLAMARAHVNTFRGCIGGGAPIGVIIAELERGEWIDEFRRASPSRYRGTLPWPQN